MCGCRSLAQVLAQNICQVGQVLHPHQLVVLYRHLVQHIVVPETHIRKESGILRDKTMGDKLVYNVHIQ